jgi:hypothetical protein
MEKCINCKKYGEKRLQDKHEHYVQYWQARWWHCRIVKNDDGSWSIDYEKKCDCGCNKPQGVD